MFGQNKARNLHFDVGSGHKYNKRQADQACLCKFDNQPKKHLRYILTFFAFFVLFFGSFGGFCVSGIGNMFDKSSVKIMTVGLVKGVSAFL